MRAEVAGCAIRFYDTHTGKRVRADDPVLQGPRANVWVTWVS